MRFSRSAASLGRRGVASWAALVLLLSAWLGTVAHVHHGDEAAVAGKGEGHPCAERHLHRRAEPAPDDCVACLTRATTHGVRPAPVTVLAPVETRAALGDARAPSVLRLTPVLHGPRGPPSA